MQTILMLTRQRMLARYRQFPRGLVELLIVPIATLALLSLVFGEILQIRWQLDQQQAYPVILFSGLLIHFFIADCLMQGANLSQEFAPIVKQTSIRLVQLAWVVVLQNLAVLSIGMGVLAGALLWMGLFSWWWCVAFCFLLLCAVPLGLGLVWFTATLAPVWPTFRQLLGPMVTGLLLLSSILYPISRVPDQWQAWLWINPNTALSEVARGMIFHHSLSISAALGCLIASIVLALLGYILFLRAQDNLQDLI